MSEALYKFGGLRFWNQEEIEKRESFQLEISRLITRTLRKTNNAWRDFRVEGPCLSPRDQISSEYDDDDLFKTNHIVAINNFFLRAETTPSSYAWARKIGGKFPLCVWQSGKVFRRETSDGATASKLRFNDFYQLEFQCIYTKSTNADYRKILLEKLVPFVERFTGKETRLVESDRLPSYSESTLDIEVLYKGRWTEVASCSIRNDFSDETKVCEIAFGLCRIVSVSM